MARQLDLDAVAALASTIADPLRVRIVQMMLDGRSAAPVDLAQELAVPLGNVSYHVRRLVDAGALKLVGSTPVRGALRHDYRLEPRVARKLGAAIDALS